MNRNQAKLVVFMDRNLLQSCWTLTYLYLLVTITSTNIGNEQFFLNWKLVKEALDFFSIYTTTQYFCHTVTWDVYREEVTLFVWETGISNICTLFLKRAWYKHPIVFEFYKNLKHPLNLTFGTKQQKVQAIIRFQKSNKAFKIEELNFFWKGKSNGFYWWKIIWKNKKKKIQDIEHKKDMNNVCEE